VRLLPREQARLQVFLAAELARRRRARGLLLGQAEAVALITDEVMESARDGLPYEAVEQRGYAILEPSDVLEEVPRLVGRIELEALFGDGYRLIVLHDPIAANGPPSLDGESPQPEWREGGAPLRITNEADVPVALSSHFHVFEANRRLSFERRAAWGMRLAVAAGVKVVLEPGETRDVRLVPFGGSRVVRGHGGLVDGPLDAPGALDRALALARERGYLGA
jgi:urease subunit gamma/beta